MIDKIPIFWFNTGVSLFFSLHRKADFMKNSSPLNVILASAFGAGTGVLLSMEFPLLLWWVGTLIGGLVGYLSYEWKQVVAAVPVAFKKVISMRRVPAPLRILFWSFTNAFFWVFNVFMVLAPVTFVGQNPVSLTSFLLGNSFFSAFLSFFWAILMLGNVSSEDVDWATSDWRENMKISFPPIFWLWQVPKFLFTEAIPFLAVLIFRDISLGFYDICCEIFLIVNSERRRICGMSALLGGTVGHFAGNNVLIGMIAGASFGFLFFELVSKRLLGLQAK